MTAIAAPSAAMAASMRRAALTAARSVDSETPVVRPCASAVASSRQPSSRGGGDADARAEHAQEIDEPAGDALLVGGRRAERRAVVGRDVEAEPDPEGGKRAHDAGETGRRAVQEPRQRQGGQAAERHAAEHDEAQALVGEHPREGATSPSATGTMVSLKPAAKEGSW